MPIERESGLNLPNVMTPGAWVPLTIALAAVLIGIGFMIYRIWSERIKWVDLHFRRVQYFAQDDGFSAGFLTAALNAAVNALIVNAKWSPSEVEKALVGFNVYVFADDANAGTVGIFGYEKDGVIGVNIKLTTLCHEMGHMLQERLEKIVDYEHSRWLSDGLVGAEKAYSDWLVKQ